MREIKFRAWHKLNKEMLYEGWTVKENGSEIFSSKATLFMLGESAEIMQYTGLKDKNVKEIYEGDICRRNGHLRIIKYKGSSFYCFPMQDKVDIDHITAIHNGWHLDNFISDLEVISNIYEHQNLLTT